MVGTKKILVLVGPTASGKSDLAIRLAKKLGGEVISADSRQVYRGLNIGTGKITQREMKGVRHHMLDVASPRKTFTAAEYARLGHAAVQDIVSRGKLPIVCGGTGFYIDALVGRATLADVAPDKKLRATLLKYSAAELSALLQALDPNRAKAIGTHNAIRLVRAIEIAKGPRKAPLVDVRPPIHDVLWIGLNPPPVLRKKIYDRLHARMCRGMIAEAKRLHACGLSYKRMHELGLEYRYLALYLQKKILREEMFTQLGAKIWQYAKRQMTYWRRNRDIQWFSSADEAYATALKQIGAASPIKSRG